MKRMLTILVALMGIFMWSGLGVAAEPEAADWPELLVGDWKFVERRTVHVFGGEPSYSNATLGAGMLTTFGADGSFSSEIVTYVSEMESFAFYTTYSVGDFAQSEDDTEGLWAAGLELSGRPDADPLSDIVIVFTDKNHLYMQQATSTAFGDIEILTVHNLYMERVLNK